MPGRTGARPGHLDVDAAIEAFGKNEHTKKVFWAVFVAVAGLVLARVLDPEAARQIVGVIAGMGGEPPANYARTFPAKLPFF
ncbi:hypothetical protein [Methanoregula sp. UBA64]|jgi:hypothetical protein|uniref:hypothetical protein n=1 Tax=Methanoregula sp. UBA64 TaxID=1915554 RepID=UPI0025E1A574|nr:hypothetical protein [Methanoregula sp. UBA64]